MSLMNVVDKVFHDKYYGKVDTEKVDWLRLYYLYTIAFFFLFTYSEWSMES